MKKYFMNAITLFVALLTLAVFLAVPVVSAAPVEPSKDVCSNLVDPSNPPAICKSAPGSDPITGSDGITTTISQTLIYIVGAVSVIMVIIGGLKYILSAGDSGGIESAKNTILYALVGLVVAVLAQTILSFVLKQL